MHHASSPPGIRCTERDTTNQIVYLAASSMDASNIPRPRVRVLRVIARMNIGGPAYHVSLLSGRLDGERYETLLLTGALGSGGGLL